MSRYDLVMLDDLLSSESVDYVHNLITDYECVYSGNLDSFLKEKAIEFSKRDLSKTYLAMNDSDKIMGYFTIGVKCFNFPNDDGSCSHKFYKLMNPDKGVIQSYLIGKLSRSKDSEKGLGTSLLKNAISILNDHRKGIGCRVVRLDCVDSLVGYYESNGFMMIKKNPDSELNQMVMVLS